ncbi:hypothetical protein SAMN05216588_106118 [Pseudomonas flavescens]|uniref:DUF2141 domain-containing protein n=1 Tax=Phytopseudomonas flavescens TaxID=29435 RepID=A0A1G8E989_9GAMM|nr:DUF2141 domain-containing protein [Pseudomonas flavescens]SDH66300.1 hypothetical protein SAMN05216588_106118 [Pseudomonas flavescens]
MALLLGSLPAQAGDLLIRLEDNPGAARLYVALVAANEKSWEAVLRELQGEGEQLIMKDVPPGQYALQLFQDSNGNGRLDLSQRGIPLEPVGFSTNPSLLKGKPAPRDVGFEHGTDDTLVDIRLRQPRAGARPAAR